MPTTSVRLPSWLARGVAGSSAYRYLDDTAGAVKAAYPATSARADVDVAGVCDCLNRAWGTELILNFTRRIASEDELVRLTNSWGAVQAYYVAYGATQALLMAEGKPRPRSHPATQKMAIDLWVTRTNAVAPWSFAIASPMHREASADGALNGRGRPLDTEIRNWSGCTRQTCWDLAAIALRSTRKEAVDEKLAQARKEKVARRRREWRDQEAQRLAAHQRPRTNRRGLAREGLTRVRRRH